MRLDPYRHALAQPGMKGLMLVALLARIPVTAAGVTLTLHVVLELSRGYGAAGLVGAASTIGAAVGAPLLGRLVDRRGLRLVLITTTVATGLFWSLAPVLSYPALLVAALISGLLSLPVFSLVRQSIAALVPPDGRRAAYSVDSMSTELSFIVGPTLAVLVVTTVSPRAAIVAVGAAMVAAGIGLLVLNPPVRSADEDAGDRAPVRRRDWLRPHLITLLVVATATTVILSGTDVAIVATLRAAGQVSWTGAVLAGWGIYSIIGGFIVGTARRPPSPAVLMGVLGLFTIPVGIATGWWALCLTLIPAGALCAPTLAATADGVSRLAPPGVRGEAMGLHGSALTLGLAIGAPITGRVIDGSGPSWGFVVAGLIGTAAAAIALPAALRQARRSAVEAPAVAEPVSAGPPQ